MKSVRVRDLMIPLEDYATVSEDADLYCAIQALEEARERSRQHPYRHRAILVYDANRRIVGKLSQIDIVRSLEPKYETIDQAEQLSRFGFGPEYMRRMIQEYGLWKSPLEDICKTAASYRVKDIMHTPGQGECVSEEASLAEAIHQLILGNHQSLLVTRGGEIVGILRLADVFNKICEMIRACRRSA